MPEKNTANPKNKYTSLISEIGNLLENGRNRAYMAVDSILVRTYWEIGKRVVEFEQHWKERAEYGSALLDTLSKDLTGKFGAGFSRDSS